MSLRAKGAVLLVIVGGLVSQAGAPSTPADINLDSEVLSLAARTVDVPKHIEQKNDTDAIASYYDNPGTRQHVVDFFAGLTKSAPVALAILENAARHKVATSLAFAIAYEESRFDPKAQSRNPSSTDRGLFQLNSSTFPELTDAEAFDPAHNAAAGIEYFKHVLDLSGNEVSALAMYNAGRTRVSQRGAPVTTLGYISRVLNYEKNINNLFAAKVAARAPLLSKIRMDLFSGAFAEGGSGDRISK